MLTLIIRLGYDFEFSTHIHTSKVPGWNPGMKSFGVNSFDEISAAMRARGSTLPVQRALRFQQTAGNPRVYTHSLNQVEIDKPLRDAVDNYILMSHNYAMLQYKFTQEQSVKDTIVAALTRFMLRRNWTPKTKSSAAGLDTAVLRYVHDLQRENRDLKTKLYGDPVND